MDKDALFRRTSALVNKAMLPLIRSGPGRRLFGGSMAVITYRGRKSGQEITLPVNYRRDGQAIVIGVMAPDAKKWWRNFTGDGAPLLVRIGSEKHEGHGVAQRADDGSVSVRLTLS